MYTVGPEGSISGTASSLAVGDAVVLLGLRKTEFHQHVGKIVTELGRSGRHGVCLACEQGRERDRAYPPIALKPENLQLMPSRMSEAPVAIVGSVGPKTVVLVLGERGWGLPDNVAKHVTKFLLIDRVSMDKVAVSGCSSDRGDFPLEAVLNNACDQWWISGPGSMPGGVGCEYLDFSFGPKPRRVECVGLRIPPMPSGPLSVRAFRLLVLDSLGQWVPASPELQTLDRSDMQKFALMPPVDTTGMRLECVRNAAAGSRSSFSDCIGLFQVSFY